MLEVSDLPIDAAPIDLVAAWQATQETWESQDLDCTGLIASRDARHAYADRIPGERGMRLRGYPGAEARTGNRVNEQFQLDCFGEALQLLAAAARHDLLTADDWRAAEVAAAAIEMCWQQPDAGIWELDDAQWTHSRLARVAGLRGIAGVGTHSGGLAARWSGLADSILASLDTSVHPSGRWQRTPSDQRVDAALLLSFVRGAVPADDPRSKATAQAVERELTDDGFVFCFRDDSRPMGEAEGAFLLCGFWMALAAHVRGDAVEAAHWLSAAGLLAGPLRCTERNTTPASASSAATCRRRSCTPRCSSAPCGCQVQPAWAAEPPCLHVWRTAPGRCDTRSSTCQRSPARCRLSRER